MSSLDLEAAVTTSDNPMSSRPAAREADGGGGGGSTDNAAPDAKKMIESFRDKRERRAARAAVGVLTVGICITLFGLQFAMISKHMDWSDPQMWAVGFGLTNVGLGLSFIVGDNLNFEREFGSITPQKPMWLAALLPYLYTYITLPKSMFEKYGWVYLYNYFVIDYWLLASLIAGLAQGQLTPFGPAVTDVPLWRRRPTVCEWYATVTSPGILVYGAIDIQLWHYGEWDGGRFGTTGALITVVTIVLLWLHWTWRWGMRAYETTPPAGYPWERRQLLGNLWFQFNMHLGTLCIVKAALAPETQKLRGNNLDLYGNLGLTALSDLGEEGPRYSSNTVLLEIGLGFVIIPAICFYGRHQIFDLLVQPFAAKQRLHDGVFIAALLASAENDDDDDDDDDDHTAAGADRAANAGGGGGDQLGERDLIAESAALMRRVPMSRVTLDVLESSPRSEGEQYMSRGQMSAAQAFDLGEACGLGGCDFFVSHSWSDDARQKYAQMMAVTLLFQQRHGREPTFWLDKVCIDQSNIAQTLRCLPVLVQSCSKLLILCGESYVSRLWCVLELYIHFAMSGVVQASKRTVITDCRSATKSSTMDPLDDGIAGLSGGGDSAAAALHTFDVKNAHCFSPEDEARLRSVIESEGAETFNAAIQEVGAALLGAPDGGSSRVSSPTWEAGAVTNSAGSLRFETLDKNQDHRLDREDLLAAFGWDSPPPGTGGEQKQAELAKRGAQIDQLLEVVNTEGELRVNGSLSISKQEFDAWIGRAT